MECFWILTKIAPDGYTCSKHNGILHRFKDRVDTIGNCQRLVFSLGVSQHFMHKITNL